MQYFDGHLEKAAQSQQMGEMQLVGRQCVAYGTKEACVTYPDTPVLGDPSDPYAIPDVLWWELEAIFREFRETLCGSNPLCAGFGIT